MEISFFVYKFHIISLIWPAKSKYLITGLLQKNVADPCVGQMDCNFYEIPLFHISYF